MYILFFTSLFFLAAGNPQEVHIQDSLHWHLNLEEAQAIAQEQDLPILIVFSGSDWCRPCMKLESELFSTDDFEAFAHTNLVLLKVDFPRSRKRSLSPEQQAYNGKLAEQFNPSGLFPFLVLISSDGKTLDQIGYLDPEPSSYINRWQTHLTP